MSTPPDNFEITRRRLLWRATHRGIKEMDLIVGGYAQDHLSSMTGAELTDFAEILEIPDQQLLSWVMNQEALPPERDSPLLRAVLNYQPQVTK